MPTRRSTGRMSSNPISMGGDPCRSEIRHRPSAICYPFTPRQETVLGELLDLLQAIGVTYQATGGLAGNFHGSLWPLNDIDCDVPQADLARLAAALGPTLIEGPRRIVGCEFDCVQVRASLQGVALDVS